MKINHSLLVLAVIFMLGIISTASYSQKAQLNKNPKPSSPSSTRFTISWMQADSLANLGQPKSALEIVNKIYAQAKKEKNDPQVIKAIIYRIRLNSDFQDDFLEKTIADLQKEISGASPPAKQVLISIMAEVYWKYYQNNQYRFRDRSRVNEVKVDSINTWDLATMSYAINNSYVFSLGADTLKHIPIATYDAIVDLEIFDSPKKDTLPAEAARLFPTLYDFLASRALDYFTTAETSSILPAQHFEVDQPWYFAQTSYFTNEMMKVSAKPVMPYLFALRIFRDLAVFHLNDEDPCAFINTELKRFEFVYEKYTLPGKDSLYLDALRQFEQAERNSPWSSSISFALASHLNILGQQYLPLISDLHKWDIRSAVEVCDKAVQRFPVAQGSKNCRFLAQSIREPFLQVTTETAVAVGKPSLALVGLKNLKQLYFRLVKADPDTYGEKAGVSDRPAFFKFLTAFPAALSWSQVFPDDGDFQKHQAEIRVPEVPAGYWVLLCGPTKDFADPKLVFAFTPFWSTQISYISKRNDDGSFAYFLLDRETGSPLKNVTAEAWEKNYDYRERKYSNVKLQTFTSDELGYLEIPSQENNRHNANRFLKLFYNNDFLVTDNFYQYPVFKGQEQTALQTMFYTDRAIYRPGQIIYFKGIILEKTGDKSKIKPNHPVKVVFTDVNGQKIAEQSLTSNKFGSFNGSFVAPTGVLPGQMTISGESGSTSFSVEEYKRPTFDVSCDPLEGNYKLGELLTVTGKAIAFAGNPIEGSVLKYRVVRSARFPFRDWGWRWPMPASPQAEVANGTTTTDSGGKFSFSFRAIPDQGVDKGTWPVFDFSIYADVTDINGETQSAEHSVSVGYKALLVETDLPEMVNLAKDTIVKITTTNLNGRHTPAVVTITLQRLRQPGRAFIQRLWDRPDLSIMTREDFHAQYPYHPYDDENNPVNWEKEDLVFEKTINTAGDSLLNILNPGSLPNQAAGRAYPGSYLLTLRATDPFGMAVETKKVLTAFAPESKAVPVNTLCWFVPLKTSGEPGETARFLIGSKDDNVRVIYEIRLHDSLVSREVIKLNNRAMQLEIPIKELYRGNFSVNFVFVKHNRVFQQSQVINVPYTNKRLGIAFETFRSKLDPGAKETWKIRISSANGKPAHAEFLAGMYDASLDLFRSNEWTFNLYQRTYGIIPWDISNSFSISSGQWVSSNEANGNYIMNPGLKLNWFGTNYFGGSMRYSGRLGGIGVKGMRAEMMDSQAPSAVMSTGITPQPEQKQEKAKDTVMPAGNRQQPPKARPEPVALVRRDFRETAFFYPSMETDSTGSLVLQFTAPESLTKWKFLGLAHTKNLDYGLVEKELVTSKEMMVFPNYPRFVRQGDTVIFSTKIVNRADHELSGEVNLALSDAITLQPLNLISDTLHDPGHLPDRLPFTVKTGQSAVVSWRLYIPVSSGLSVMQCRVTAVSGSFSDGEEKAIPVLTNRMLVTESLPLPVRGAGTSGFSFDKLLKSGQSKGNDATLKNYKFTLEFASNPAWYAIQALPVLNDKQYDNANDIFSAFWSNSVAAFIANSNPKIKAVFETWESLTPDALQSNLSKNQSLKSALLQETPWVMEAISETGRKQKLGLFFDPGNLRENLQENFKKLKKLQLPDGGWTWFEGMPENRYITQNILTGLGQLHHLGITNILSDPSSREMVLKAIGFLDGELLKDYENLKKYQPDHLDGNHSGNAQVQYLYARSFFMKEAGFIIPDPDAGRSNSGSSFAEAFAYYKKQASKYWLQNDRYQQGMIALALNRLDNGEVPLLIMKSLKEKALRSEETGMYWAGEPGYFWYQAPIETQALMIEAFDEITQDKSTVEELKIWLLKQKQTQDWRSPRATLEACYALLLRGTNLLTEDPGVKITLGKEKISSGKLIDVQKELGTGYFQVSWSGDEIKPEMGKITVSKTGEGVAWGAVYWQYFENLDLITTAATPLKLEKNLFVEKNTPSGPVLEPLSKSKIKNQKSKIADSSSAYEVPCPLHTGDKIMVRIILSVDRDLEFVHMKDMRASGLEPGNPTPKQEGGLAAGLSGYRYQDGLGYYQSTTDQATNFFFDYLPKGTYVFEYGLKVNAAGDYSNGITTIQCMYAPEFTAHSEGIRINVR